MSNNIDHLQVSENYDLIIVGAGIVGSLLALLIAQDDTLDYSIALVDPVFGKSKNDDPLSFWNESQRVSAVNHSLYKQLCRVLPIDIESLAQRMDAMQVVTPECGGQFQIDALEYSDDPLAWVLSNKQLAGAIIDSLAQFDKITKIAEPVNTIEQVFERPGYRVQTTTRALQASLLVGADGAYSTVRREFGFVSQSIGEPAQALSAQILLPSHKRSSMALQWFFRDGSILGLLPVAGDFEGSSIMSMVWSVPAGAALPQTLRAQDLELRLKSALSQTSFAEFGYGLEVISTVKKWPLKRYLFDSSVLVKSHPGLFFIGDAAHSIHPLAGQGLNLGLQDTFKLYNALVELQQQGFSPLVVSRYVAARALEARQMLWLCEGLRAFFEQKAWPLQFFGALAFKQFDRHTFLKKQIVQLMSYRKVTKFLNN